MVLEPLRLKIGNEYNLNNVKEIKVTDEFLTLDKSIINCQNKESQQDCKTRKYLDTILQQCKCLPFGIMYENNKVTVLIFFENEMRSFHCQCYNNWCIKFKSVILETLCFPHQTVNHNSNI